MPRSAPPFWQVTDGDQPQKLCIWCFLFLEFGSLTTLPLWGHSAQIRLIAGSVVHSGKLGVGPDTVEVCLAGSGDGAKLITVISAQGCSLPSRVLSVASLLLP